MVSCNSSSCAHVMPGSEERNGNSVKVTCPDLIDARTFGPRGCDRERMSPTAPQRVYTAPVSAPLAFEPRDAPPPHPDEIAARGLRINASAFTVRIDTAGTVWCHS